MRRLASLVVGSLLLLPVTSVTAAPSPAPIFEEAAPKVAPSRRPTGRIVIPKLGLKAPIFTGITMDVFDRGVGQWPGTPRAGEPGNIVLGGHRTAANRPFVNIDKLRSGDVIELHTRGTVHKYKVTGHLIVKPTAIWITDQTISPTLTLFACHPKGKTTQRYVIRATLMS